MIIAANVVMVFAVLAAFGGPTQLAAAVVAAGIEKAITFEFSHFMSPYSSYLQAGHLFNRYRKHFGA